MAKGAFPEGPNYVHPEKPSAVGSRNSLNRDTRNEYLEAQTIIDEEVDKVLNHMSAKLPPEVLEKLHVSGNVKEMLHNYYNQGFQNMFNRYLTTVEDEMGKKFRGLLDKEEYKNLNKYTPRGVSDLLNQIAGLEKFNTSEVEKSVVNIYGHLQGHLQRGTYDLEQETNSILRQKEDVGAFVRGENTYSVVKCSFKNNYQKPETVSDIKLVINILDKELISPIYHYQIATEFIIKDIVSGHICNLVDREVEKINAKLLDEGEVELSENEKIFEKFKGLEKYIDHGEVNENSKQYAFVENEVFNAIESIGPEIDNIDFDPLQVRENIQWVVDNENIRNRGFNTAVNALTSILDTSRMGYQHIENFKNNRELVIREYGDSHEAALPDERFTICMSYVDDLQLKDLRTGYHLQLDEFNEEVQKLWDISCKLYSMQKEKKGDIDFEDVYSTHMPNTSEKLFFGTQKVDSILEEEKLWDEITFIEPKPTDLEKMNETFMRKREKILQKMSLIRIKLSESYGTSNPEDRVVVEQRLDFLENQFNDFNATFNPYHAQPGLILELAISTIKRKKTTMMGMSNVLNEFLSGVSRGFSDSAFAGFSRRRSTDTTNETGDFQSVQANLSPNKDTVADTDENSNIEGVAEVE